MLHKRKGNGGEGQESPPKPSCSGAYPQAGAFASTLRPPQTIKEPPSQSVMGKRHDRPRARSTGAAVSPGVKQGKGETLESACSSGPVIDSTLGPACRYSLRPPKGQTDGLKPPERSQHPGKSLEPGAAGGRGHGGLSLHRLQLLLPPLLPPHSWDHSPLHKSEASLPGSCLPGPPLARCPRPQLWKPVSAGCGSLAQAMLTTAQ